MKLEIQIDDPTHVWDSESEWRDFTRQKIREACLSAVYQLIDKYAVTNTEEERDLIMWELIGKLIESTTIGARHRLFRREALDAEQILEKKEELWLQSRSTEKPTE